MLSRQSLINVETDNYENDFKAISYNLTNRKIN